MSRTLARLTLGFANLICLPLNPKRRLGVRSLAAEMMGLEVAVETRYGPIRFHIDNRRALEYPANFHKDEPETLDWIDRMPMDGVLWDIGANIGCYVLYAAKRGLTVLAFEPSAASYAALCKNVFLNKLDGLASPFCLAFSEKVAIDTLYMQDVAAGASMHAFGTAINAEENDLSRGLRQPALGFSIDKFIEIFSPTLPTHLKIDVDSIEDQIIIGASTLLTSGTVKSILVEVMGDPDKPRNRTIIGLLQERGFQPRPKSDPTCLNMEFVRA